jgi:hypothetical protein
MNLYDRDYNIMTDEENSLWTELQEKERITKDGVPCGFLRNSYYYEYPKAARHFMSLFPNNLIDNVDLKLDVKTLQNNLNLFKEIIDNREITERQILNFIKNTKSYFIVGSILKNGYLFGHHSLYLFPEFKMTTDYQVDYLMVGKNSAGYHFVFLELENPYNNITVKDGSFGLTLRNGIKQIDDWEFWLENNFAHMRPLFENAKNIKQDLPKEFYVFDKTRFHYIVMGGRREDFNEKTYRLGRSELERRKLRILHYDNLIDFAEKIIGAYTF